ncbi:MAG: FAD-binding protein [Lachnospiraceae bacterium]|nr:FAD-binding protein [Lachnospiraceae bacterium]
MIRITGLKLNINHTNDDLIAKAAKELKISAKEIKSFIIIKKSIDARKGEVKYIYSVDVEVNYKLESELIKKKYLIKNNISLSKRKLYTLPAKGKNKLNYFPVVVGSGPAGLFCAYALALKGYKPVVIERGQCVEERDKSVETFWKTGVLNSESNVQFGEGGAGTFSDGKLNTLVSDKFGRNTFVLEVFNKFGAPDNILYDGKPHIGTDILKDVVKNMREFIIESGGVFRFNTKLTDIIIKDASVCEIELNSKEKMPCDVLITAIGHSARDTFKMMYDKNIIMEPKAFAVGVRIEHPQVMINYNQYGEEYYDKLPAAPYKLAKTVQTGRNVYSFCMCPGGYVVNASSENEMIAVNGMSYSKRDSYNANSAIIVNVTPNDFGNDNPLAGLEFQRRLEKNAYREGNKKVPVQLYGDFKNDKKSKEFGDVLPCIKGDYELSNLRNVLPEYISESLIQGIDNFSNVIKNYNRYDAVMSGVESRTSSPLRIIRDDNLQSNIKGLYPCGEGAGYAGGITSAAMDGLKVAEMIITKYDSFDEN